MHTRFLLPLMLVWFATIALAAAADDEPLIIFNLKNFTDTGNMVHVEGTLTGEGIGYKNNRQAVTCYQGRRECLASPSTPKGDKFFR
jgi:hypothetical protein